MNHIPHYNRWSGPSHDGKKATHRRAVDSVNLFIVPALRPKQEPDKAAVETPPDVIAADTMMEELHECPALPVTATDEVPGWDWNETAIDEFEEDEK